MKATFFCKSHGDPFTDPSLFVRFRRKRRAFLFDAGNLSLLNVSEIYMITHLFITHMHIDHFIGFDSLLRCILKRDMPLIVYGPEGVIEAIKGKLAGYTWNLIGDYTLRIDVYEVRPEVILHSSFSASDKFREVSLPNLEASNVLLSDEGCTVNTFIFDHGIPVLGFSLKEDIHININKEFLNRKGFLPGPWLSDFKIAIRNGAAHREFIINGSKFTTEELYDLAIISRGMKITYITDIGPCEKNIKAAIMLARDSDILFIESFFSGEESKRAVKRNHLTTLSAGEIARKAMVKKIEIIHISQKYITMREKIYREVMSSFNK